VRTDVGRPATQSNAGPAGGPCGVADAEVLGGVAVPEAADMPDGLFALPSHQHRGRGPAPTSSSPGV
jgi:hypothetical protein